MVAWFRYYFIFKRCACKATRIPKGMRVEIKGIEHNEYMCFLCKE